MRHAGRILTFLAAVSAASAFGQAEPKPRPSKGPRGESSASGTRGAVVAGGAEAVAIGRDVLRSGGNAADAAAATLLAQTVTDAHLYCFGGEVPILVYDAKANRVELIAGQGVAPRRATREHFAGRFIPLKGIESATVPATLDAIVTLLERHGTRRFAEVAAPTLAILDRGEFRWHADLAATLRELVAAEATTEDRATGLRRVADTFYRGPIARRIDAWSKANGGLLRYKDLATHVTRIEEPVTASYRGYTVVKPGAWTQGPALLEALGVLDGFDLRAAGASGGVHLQVEALKLGFADRDAYYADPLFVDVPLAELLAPSYAASRRELLDPARASRAIRPGDPRRGRALLDPKDIRIGPGNPDANDTSTCLTSDAAGNVIAATPSGWSGALAGDTGVWLNSRLQSFNLWEGHPNVLEPGKRPRITLTPTLVRDATGPVRFAVSVAGGDLQDQVTLGVLTNLIDLALDPAAAVTAPRFSTDHLVGSFGQKPPALGSLTVDANTTTRTIAELAARGHLVTVSRTPIGYPSALRRDPATGRVEVGGDARTGRHAAAE
jgi:gamma-glutamyltranspeptidase/glutathione hydrolase